MTVHVFGHRNPDTDAICSAIAYADFLRRTTRPDAVAACCGAPNERTEFALRQAKVSLPRIIMDVRPELRDICNREMIYARPTDVFYDVYTRMNKHGLRSIPVLDENDCLLGLATLLGMLDLVFRGGMEASQSRGVRSTLRNVVSVLGGQFQHEIDSDRTEDLIVTVGAMSAGGFTERLSEFPPDRLLVVSGDRPTIQLPALEMGVRALVVTGGFELSSGLAELARNRGVAVIRSDFDTATTTTRIKAAQMIEGAIDRACEVLPAKMPVTAAKNQIYRSSQPVFPVLEGKKLVGVLSKSDLVHPPRPQLVLVDHNELGQAVEGVEEADIIEVLDHHRLGGSLKSTGPIRFTMDPVGSTCTLVARMYRQADIEPEPGIALCMASGIISDTLYLRSPTTTDVDRDILDWLQKFVKQPLEQFATDFFQVGSALRSSPPDRVVREDCKQFEEGDKRFSISQIEEIGFDLFWQRQNELAQALSGLADENSLDFSALMVTDISSNGSLLLMSSEPVGWDEINYPQLEDRLYKLDNVVSRKKQLLPLISSLLESASMP
ncbi:putative manganese-dependent inorganic diphosphatase [Allorhodopirellula solitaria]|uniref:inorganic diphosphatase n=1 Tax=Allorhodopirellula solitaria TaxID=2527987 RepID=A0A5C5YK05_9BACT|nr:putative manganese-dependent inorganic diphosphatase [Allorhodopirellula solitaria]TWT75194.1 Cobalt-dependent inorganic pyrophosphatase [Allorhodopirellula solitaria]